jgi:hypothetical protein
MRRLELPARSGIDRAAALFFVTSARSSGSRSTAQETARAESY